MGTRNLFTIIHENKVVLAKYNQWDGDLEGQGKDLSDFIENDLKFESLKSGISRIKLLDSDKDDAIISDIYDNKGVEKYPLITRNTNIRQQLQIINLGVLNLLSVDASDFKKDGLFCEYAYELNLDDNTVSVFVPGPVKNKGNDKDFGACDKLLFKCDILQYPETLDKHIELNKVV